MAKIALVDNYDSFTWNLVHYLGEAGADVHVVRNDAVTADALIGAQPDAIVLSPGPCTPNEAGICLDVVRQGAGIVPIFGVCLGFQAIGQAFGGDIIRGPVPMHGKLSQVRHSGNDIFEGISGPFSATRYHSLIIDRETLPGSLEITGETSDGLIMAGRHREHPVWGVQFHPESIASEYGRVILKNFLTLAARWRESTAAWRRSNAAPSDSPGRQP